MTDIITKTLQAIETAEAEKRAIKAVRSKQQAFVDHLEAQNRERAVFSAPPFTRDVTGHLETIGMIEETALSRSILLYVAQSTLVFLEDYSALPPIQEIVDALFTEFHSEPESGPAGDYQRWYQNTVHRAYGEQIRLLEDAYLNAGVTA